MRRCASASARSFASSSRSRSRRRSRRARVAATPPACRPGGQADGRGPRPARLHQPQHHLPLARKAPPLTGRQCGDRPVILGCGQHGRASLASLPTAQTATSIPAMFSSIKLLLAVPVSTMSCPQNRSLASSPTLPGCRQCRFEPSRALPTPREARPRGARQLVGEQSGSLLRLAAGLGFCDTGPRIPDTYPSPGEGTGGGSTDERE